MANNSKTTLVKKLTVYESLLSLDNPADVFLLLWSTFIGLWICTYQKPQFVGILLISAAVVLFRCALILLAKIVEFFFNQKGYLNSIQKLANNKNELINQSVELSIAISIAFFLLLISSLVVVMYEHYISLMVGLGAIFLFALSIVIYFIEYKNSDFVKVVTAIISTKLILQLIKATLYSLGILFAFSLVLGEFTILAWQLTVINLFLALGYIFTDDIYQKVKFQKNIKNKLSSNYCFSFGVILFCYFVYLALMLGVFYYINSSINFLLLGGGCLLLGWQAFRFWQVSLACKNNTDNTVNNASEYLYKALRDATLFPLLLWLSLINWQSIL